MAEIKFAKNEALDNEYIYICKVTDDYSLIILTNQRSGSESRFTVEELYTVRINDGL